MVEWLSPLGRTNDFDGLLRRGRTLNTVALSHF
jgi:hypothetical protein